MKRMIGWKWVNEKLQRRGFQYRVGKWTPYMPEIRMCGYGYHWCNIIHLPYWYDYGPCLLLVEALPKETEVSKTKNCSARIFVHRAFSTKEVRYASLLASPGITGYKGRFHYNPYACWLDFEPFFFPNILPNFERILLTGSRPPNFNKFLKTLK